MADKVVEIPGLGVLAFPDTMPDYEIEAKIAEYRGQREGRQRPAMTFAVVNGQRVPVADPEDFTPGPQGSALERFASSLGEKVDPRPLAQTAIHALSSPQGMEETLGGLYEGAVQGSAQQFEKAREAYQQGRYVEAAGHGLAGAVPLVGPAAADTGEQFARGDVAGGLGSTVGLLAPFGYAKAAKATGLSALSSKAVAALRARVAAGAALTPTEIAWLRGQGVEPTAAMASENPAVKGAQFMADRSLGGSLVSTPANAELAQGMTQLSDRLATEAHPTPVTGPQAGMDVRQSLLGTADTLTQQASGEYRPVWQAQEASTPVKVETHPYGSQAYQQLFQKLKQGASGALTRDDLYVMRQIEAELDAQPYSRGRLVRDEGGTGTSSSYVKGQANADVYHDILQMAPGTSEMTGAQMRNAIAKTLETGTWTDASTGALRVARQRLQRAAGDVRNVGGPSLGPDVPVLGTSTKVQFPTYLQVVKESLQPIYAELDQIARSTPAAMLGSKADAYNALAKLINGPDVVTLKTAEGLLGAFKDAARANIKELRTPGEGIFAHAVEQLQGAVDDAARQAGGDVAARLKAGRQITYEKHGIGKLVEGLVEKASGPEGQSIVKQLTAPDDGAINYLRQVRDAAPAEIPKVARAKLTSIVDAVQGPSDWGNKAKGMVSEWRKLGPETKLVLYGPELTESLNRFFKAVDRIGQTNVNPSGTGPAVMLTAQALELLKDPFAWTGLPAQAVAMVVSNATRSPAVVDALTQGLRLPRAAGPAAQAAARTNLLQALQQAGITPRAVTATTLRVPPVPSIPLAAQAGPTPDGGTGRRPPP